MVFVNYEIEAVSRIIMVVFEFEVVFCQYPKLKSYGFGSSSWRCIVFVCSVENSGRMVWVVYEIEIGIVCIW